MYEHNECSNMRKARRDMDLLRVVYEYVLLVYTLEVIDLEHPRTSTRRTHTNSCRERVDLRGTIFAI